MQRTSAAGFAGHPDLLGAGAVVDVELLVSVQDRRLPDPYLALGPGDVVLTGAPSTSAPVRPGDRVDITLGASAR